MMDVSSGNRAALVGGRYLVEENEPQRHLNNSLEG
jgi:hypothetical protein